jgi:hypothetical protein
MAITPRIRVLVLRRDGSRCRLCGATAEQASLEVDHWLARAEGGSDDLDNLHTLCRDCNRGKGRLFFGMYAEFARQNPILRPQVRSAIRPPLEYQVSALRQIFDHLRSSGVREVTLYDLPRSLSLPLRDGVNPIFEPLSLGTVADGLEVLLVEGQLVDVDADDPFTLRFPTAE